MGHDLRVEPDTRNGVDSDVAPAEARPALTDDAASEPSPGSGAVATASPTAEPTPEPAPPSTVGERFDLGERLGRGAAATVYRASDRLLGREVAVKIFAPGIGTLESASVRREMQATAQVAHPGVLEVFDVGEVDDRVFLVTRLVPGGSLADALDRGPLPVEVVVGLAGELLAALGHVHALGIVHRDVKPGNVLLDPDPDGPDDSRDPDHPGPARVHPVLADFGVAAMATATTVHGQVTGTAAYLAPEQVRGEDVGSPADVYALGLVLIECLTGRREFPGGPVESSVARLHRDPVVPDDLPEALRSLLAAMTSAAPVDRPTALEARERLRALAEPLGLDEETLAVPSAMLAADAAPAARSPIVLGAVPVGTRMPAAPPAPAGVPEVAAPMAPLGPPHPPPPAPGRPPGGAEPPTGPVVAQTPAPRARTLRRGLLLGAVAVVLAGGVVGGVALTGGSTPFTAAPAAPVPGAPAAPAPAPPAPPAPPPPGTVPAAGSSTEPGPVAADPTAPGEPEDPDGGDAPLPVPPAPAPSTPGTPPAPTPCRSVVSSLAGTGATARIVFTNRAAAACTLVGFPAVRWVGAGGKAVGAPATHAGARGAALTLAPGGSVAATLKIVPVSEFDAKNCDAVAVRGLSVRAPGTTTAATLPRAGKACSGKIGKPQLAVSPVAAL
jgi:hypothetical protein